MVARVLPESVRKKVVIMHGVKGLDEFILPSNRPEEFGGSDVPLGQAPEHLQFLQLAMDWDLVRAERGGRGGESESGPQSGSGSGYYSNKSSRNGSIQGRSRRDSEKESDSGHRKKTSKKKKISSGSSSSSAAGTQVIQVHRLKNINSLLAFLCVTLLCKSFVIMIRVLCTR